MRWIMMGHSNLDNFVLSKNSNITAQNVHDILRKKMFVDGFDLVLDLEKSHGLILVDEKTGEEYLDFFSFFASAPIGINHPKMSTEEFRKNF
jgi:L-lysine 6-transaminase